MIISRVGAKKQVDSPGVEPKKYPAVSIVSPSGCCLAAKSLAGQRILVRQAPRLPLADCRTPAQCQCRFRKYADRRDAEEDRRHVSSSMRSVLYAGKERRRSSGRRDQD